MLSLVFRKDVSNLLADAAMLLHCFLVGSLIVGSLLGLLLELLLPLATVVLIAYVLYNGFRLLAVFDLS